MPPNLPPFAQIRSLVAVVAYGRLNRAAEALELTESAVSHHLRKLEHGLGARLLERERAGIALTPAGERFHARARQALQLLEEAVDEVRGPARGKVLLTLPRSLATHWLVPRYPSLYRDDDDPELQLLPTTRRCDLEREQIDLGLRLGQGHWPGLQARFLMPERIAPVAVPELARAWQQQGWETRMAQARPILNELHPDEWSSWCSRTGRTPPPRERCRGLESFDFVLQAGLAGSGLIMGRSPMVDDAVARADLIAPFDDWIETGDAYYAVWPESRPPTRHARRVLDWLVGCVDV